MKQKTPYKAHIFVCTNTRNGKRESCGDHDSEELKSLLKQYISDKGWKGRARVSSSGCLGLCSTGPNVIIYPQQILFSKVSVKNLNQITKALDSLLNE